MGSLSFDRSPPFARTRISLGSAGTGSFSEGSCSFDVAAFAVGVDVLTDSLASGALTTVHAVAVWPDSSEALRSFAEKMWPSVAGTFVGMRPLSLESSHNCDSG